MIARHAPTMIARYHRAGSGRVPVGPLVFKTSGAALGAARWVRLPRVPATEDARCRPDRPRPPSVERLLGRRARPRLRRPGADARRRVAGGRPRGRRRRARRGSRPASAADGRRGAWRRERRAAGSTAFADPAAASGLTPVINATGVILHTNLGRAPWPRGRDRGGDAGGRRLLAARVRPRRRPARAALPRRGGAPDRADRRRGRAGHDQQRGGARARGRARRAGAASRSRAASWSRSAAASGSPRSSGGPARAWSRSGTTNRTRAADFEAPLADGRATVVLRVHPSNFAQTGFVEAPDADRARAARPRARRDRHRRPRAAARCSRRRRSGWPTSRRRAERLAAGADLVTFSGDKLVGGPQAGLIVGRADLIARIRRDPLARAVRPEKVTLAALAATLGLYRAGRATTEIPVWRMIAATPEALGRRADALLAALPAAARSRVVGHRDGPRRSAAGRCRARRSSRSGWS